ncbi:MAG: KxYKxGKxW signal peptide domain-containing protein, partial [Bombilactobacillus mellifer]|nr:KxYKxGKxW signal peptide domain-containing protein [Bombilactobacillus mellifer]
MSFKNKNYILMDQKVHYKMHKSKKQWLVIGISTFGLCLGVGIPTNLVKAESQTLKSPITTKDHKQKDIAISDLVSDNDAESPFTGISENYSTEEPFSQQFDNQQLSTVPVKTGYINAGTDQTGNLQLQYFNGISNGTDLKGQQSRGRSWGEVASINDDSQPLFFTPNFSIKMGNGNVWSWVFKEGSLSTSAPFFAGINNDWKTADHGKNWKFWEISQSSDPLNSIITLKFTGDFEFGTDKTYTLDFTITLKPNGNMVDYNLAIRNVTALVNPSISAEEAKLPNFWFGSEYDTMLGDNDAVPMYYSGNNQGLYLEHGGYRLLFNYTSKNAPTGWGAGRWKYKDFASVGINSPQDAGQKSSPEAAVAGKVAYSGDDSALYMVWKGQDLANGDSREGNYQASISSSTAILPIITISNPSPDNYIGKDYTVNGTVTYPVNNNGALPLKYYYIVDNQDPVEFNGPEINGTSPQDYSFTIPKEKMEPGDEHSISVYAVDAYGTSSNTKFLKLTANAELNTVDKTYYSGDQFMPFANFTGGVSVTGEALNSSDITKTEIKDASGQVIPEINWDTITRTPGTYTITYTYKYGSGREGTIGGEVSKSAAIKVIDRKYINLNYVDQNGNPIDSQLLTQLPAGMSSGQHGGAYGSQFTLNPSKTLTL